jgi:hypothetical protein
MGGSRQQRPLDGLRKSLRFQNALGASKVARSGIDGEWGKMARRESCAAPDRNASRSIDPAACARRRDPAAARLIPLGQPVDTMK